MKHSEVKEAALALCDAEESDQTLWDAFSEAYASWLFKKGRTMPNYLLIKALVRRNRDAVLKEMHRL